MAYTVAPSMPATKTAEWLAPSAWPASSATLFTPAPFDPERTHWGLPVITQYDDVEAALLNSGGEWSREVPFGVLPKEARHCTLYASWGADGDTHALLRKSLTPINRGSTDAAREFTVTRATSLFERLLNEAPPWDLSRVVYQVSMEVVITQTLKAPPLLPYIDDLRRLIREHVATPGGFFNIERQPEAEDILHEVINQWGHLEPGGIAQHLVRQYEQAQLTEEQVIGQLWLLCASHETQATAAASMLGMLLEYGELGYAQQCFYDEDALRFLVDEVARRSIVFPASVMVATKPVQYNGRVIMPGSACLVSNAAANLDPARFDDPLTFNPRARRRQYALAFGHGPHHCQGEMMSRHFLRDILAAALAVLPTSTFLTSGRVLRETSISMAVTRLPVQAR